MGLFSWFSGQNSSAAGISSSQDPNRGVRTTHSDKHSKCFLIRGNTLRIPLFHECICMNVCVRLPLPSVPSAQPLPNCQLRLEEPVFMEVWLNPVLTAFTYDLLILLLHSPTSLPISWSAPPPFVPFLYSSYSLFFFVHSFFVQPCMISHPSCSRCLSHPAPLCI